MIFEGPFAGDELAPRHIGGAATMLGSAELAWDAARGVPLKFAIFARGQSSPVIQLKVTDISYGKVPASDFNVTPPSGAVTRMVGKRLATDLRRDLATNGLRAGVLGQELPTRLRELLASA